MMGKIYSFEREPYRVDLDVKVVRVGEEKGTPFAVLDDTILYPAGGGQPSDRGWLGDVAVTHVERVKGNLRHYLEIPVDVGPDQLSLDWARRYDHMQQHTAQHLLTSLALRRFDWTTRSFHIGPECSDIELAVEPPSQANLNALEDAVAEVVVVGAPIRAFRVSPQEMAQLRVRSRGLPDGHRGDIRLVEIEGVDLNTCGGTHVASTAEVEAVKILRAEPLRGGCRVYWVAGNRVRRRLGEHEARIAELRKLFDTGDEDLVAVAELKLNQLGLVRRQQRQLEERLAHALLSGLLERGERVVALHLEDAEATLLRRVAEGFAARGERRVGFFSADADTESLFILARGKGCPLDLSDVGPRVMELLAGRGGGAGALFQGKAPTLEKRDEVLELLRELADDLA
jgi:Ser-tRNA(Ala) deacylase AlaX